MLRGSRESSTALPTRMEDNMTEELRKIRNNARVAYRENLERLSLLQRKIDALILAREEIPYEVAQEYEQTLLRTKEHWSLYYTTSQSLKSLGF
jgi:hypothetical protein